MSVWGKSAWIVAGLLMCLGAEAREAAVARIELHSVPSLTLTDRQFLTGSTRGEPVTITGELRLPTDGGGRLPAALLLHGSAGISGYVADWADELNAWGFATFVLDSFTGRNLTSVLDDQGQLGRLAMIVDAYRALELLAAHPRVDPARIAVVGFSRGAQAALYASLERFQRMHGPQTGARFAGYVAFYPLCNTVFRMDTRVSEEPILILHGSTDELNPVTACRRYVTRLRGAGGSARLIEYAGAHHVFDWPALRPALKLPEIPSTRNCRLEEGSDGRILNIETGRPFEYTDACIERGVTLAHDAQAHDAARKELRAFTDALRDSNERSARR